MGEAAFDDLAAFGFLADARLRLRWSAARASSSSWQRE
jgi:hypothetical protein